ncbi:hypothetical protein ACUH93_07130 [Dermabacteraceae bacterium P7006]
MITLTAADWADWAKDCTNEAESADQLSEDYTSRAEFWTKRAEKKAPANWAELASYDTPPEKCAVIAADSAKWAKEHSAKAAKWRKRAAYCEQQAAEVEGAGE